jgi:Outer membrane protein beta-barrel domain
MKKLITFLVFYFLVSCISAQKTGIGLRLNAHFANWSTIDPELVSQNLKSTTGLSLSVPFEFKLSSMFSIQPELMYIQKGVSSLYTSSSTTIDKTATVNYLELPILFKASFLEESPIGIGLLAGPSLGLALGGTSKEIRTKSSSVTTTSSALDFTYYQKFEIGAHIGVNATYTLGTGKLIFDARYLLGFTNLNSTPNSTSIQTLKNAGFSIGIGYMHYL